MATVLNDRKNNDRKIFCGGLSKDVSEQDLQDYFSECGGVESVNLKIDTYTKQSRGFGFVVFDDKIGVEKALLIEKHELKGKTFECKQAEGPEPMLKVFAGGLKQETSEDDVRCHFEQFGNITNINVAVDKFTGKKRGFAFITFESEDMADAASSEKKQNILGKDVDVKKAEPEGATRGGRGGGRGSTRGTRGQSYNSGYGAGYGGAGSYYNDYNNGYSGGYDNYNQYDNYSSNYSQGYNNGYAGSYNDSYGQGGYGYSRPASGGYGAPPAPAGARGRYQPY